ncbi:Receptor-like protein 12 [Morella rubra]|uniref:Receptor-like protein 12 n=1 Tax=Morella rubra TaxID=262757 RepID=A0A6A1V9R8_9ROSI|nr:Receptor-like protein 12 [Morella rubra]
MERLSSSALLLHPEPPVWAGPAQGSAKLGHMQIALDSHKEEYQREQNLEFPKEFYSNAGMTIGIDDCRWIQFLHVGDNEIHDTFPFWLGTLAQLKILVLRSNGFHGVINDPETNDTFPKLRIIDLSHNDFYGNLPSRYFPQWNSMRASDAKKLTYLHVDVKSDIAWGGDFDYSVKITNKGKNKLVGEILPELVQLNFLEVFNVSNNSLTGPIPRGKQFDTFQINSFEHNPGLCGRPLSKTCGDSSLQQPSIFEENQGSESLFEFDWKVVVIGYGSGLVVGIFIGQIMIPKEHDWFVRIF